MTAKAQQILADAMTEADLQHNVIDLARRLGYLVHHCRPAQTRSGGWATPIQGDAGFPDLILTATGRRRSVAAELKSMRGGQPTDAQRRWLDAFAAAGIPSYVWTPADWLSGEITHALSAKGGR